MQVTPFDFKGRRVRVVMSENGEPHWVASDVAKVLGYRSAPEVSRFVRGRHKGIAILDTPGGKQQMTVLSEAGLYAAIMKSRAKAAEAFQDWVTDEVLPSIRRRGGYLTPAAAEEALTNPDFIIRLATDLKAERARRAELEEQTLKDAPKVLFADAVATSDTAILIGDLAKILRGNGIEVGANRLFRWMRAEGFLISRKGTDWNMPTQRAMELGLFRIKETSVTHSDGHVTVSRTPKVTGKGQTYFVSRFMDGRFTV
ncbi:phage antirepressor Ant [Corynebacterium mastitidis]|uniref:Phage antirepressor Ant n=2 Tax=Corynebacterium mastitidis TaxID=161890 RepID=A0A2N0X924_9CORY|nr:phage antirepressor Ant [Corynebacterium mastitidis]